MAVYLPQLKPNSTYVNSNYTISDLSRRYLVDISVGNVTITLPTAQLGNVVQIVVYNTTFALTPNNPTSEYVLTSAVASTCILTSASNIVSNGISSTTQYTSSAYEILFITCTTSGTWTITPYGSFDNPSSSTTQISQVYNHPYNQGLVGLVSGLNIGSYGYMILPLNNTAGTSSLVDISGNAYTATATNATFGVADYQGNNPGACTLTSAGSIITQFIDEPFNGFSLSVAFKTTSTTASTILNVSNNAVPTTSGAVVSLTALMDASGHIGIGDNNTSNTTTYSTQTYNDGVWHLLWINLFPLTLNSSSSNYILSVYVSTGSTITRVIQNTNWQHIPAYNTTGVNSGSFYSLGGSIINTLTTVGTYSQFCLSQPLNIQDVGKLIL